MVDSMLGVDSIVITATYKTGKVPFAVRDLKLALYNLLCLLFSRFIFQEKMPQGKSLQLYACFQKPTQ
jgi:hypothetical protein